MSEPAVKAVCRNCGADDSFYAEGTVEAWQDCEVTFDGPTATAKREGRLEHDGPLEVDAYRCFACQARNFRLEKLVKPKPREDEPEPPTVHPDQVSMTDHVGTVRGA